MYEIRLLPSAEKDLDQFSLKIFNKLKSRILTLADNPRAFGSLKLTNEEGFRIRVGDYRILYRIDENLKEVYIYRIKHRKDVYK